MAILTPAQLQASNSATYTTNGSGSITGASARSFNADFISSSITVSQTGSMNVLSASYAATASLLLGSVVSASYALTSSYAVSSSNAVSSSYAVTASYASIFPFTGSAILSGSIVITGSAYGNIVAAAVASNTASIDLAAGNFFTVTLANNATTFFNFTNVKQGLAANLVLTTGTVSSASFSSNVKQPSGSSYLPSSGSGRVDALSVIAADASNLYLVAVKTFV